MGKNIWAFIFVALLLLWFLVNSLGLMTPYLRSLHTESPQLTLQNFTQLAKGDGIVLGDRDPRWLSLFNLKEGENPDWKMVFAPPEELKLYAKAPINLKNPIKFTDKQLDDFVARKKLLGIVQVFRDAEDRPVMLITSMDGKPLPLFTHLETLTTPAAFNLDGSWYAIPIDQSVRLIEPIFYLGAWWQENRLWVVTLLAFLGFCFIIYTQKNLTKMKASL